MRREERNQKKKRHSDKSKPPKLMIEKELKKGELDKLERQKLKDIVNKGKFRSNQQNEA